MIRLKRENGYGNSNVKEVNELIDKYLPVGSVDKCVIKEFVYDYERLIDVIDGRAVFGHPDGSEVRRIKLY